MKKNPTIKRKYRLFVSRYYLDLLSNLIYYSQCQKQKMQIITKNIYQSKSIRLGINGFLFL